MADVARGHGGGCGGDPPGGGDQQSRLGGCGGDGRKRGRGKSRNVEMRKLWKKNDMRPSRIQFDGTDVNGSWRAVGIHANYFTSLLGTLVQAVPLRFSSWEKVPDTEKLRIMPEIEMYFEMQPHYEGPNNGDIRAGIEGMCAERYRDRKSRFKRKWFDHRGGPQMLSHFAAHLRPT